MAERKHPVGMPGIKDQHRAQVENAFYAKPNQQAEEMRLTSGKPVQLKARARDFGSGIDLAMGGEADNGGQPWEPIGHRKKSIKRHAHSSSLAALRGDAQAAAAGPPSAAYSGGGGAGVAESTNPVDPSTGQAAAQRLSPSKQQAMKVRVGLGRVGLG